MRHRAPILVTLFLATVGVAHAQIANVTNATATPTAGVGHDYLKLLNETVDPSTGSVSVRVATPTPPGRGLTLSFAFTYDSNSFSLQLAQPGQLKWNFNQNLFANGPWSNTLPVLSATLLQYQKPSSLPNPCLAATGYMFQDPSGGRHALGLSAILSNFNVNVTPSCGSTNWQNFLAAGDDFFKAAISGIPTTGATNLNSSGPGSGEVRVADASGTVYDFANSSGGSNSNSWNCAQTPISINTLASSMPRTIEDRNGNVITISQPCAGSAFTISDTTGRAALSLLANGRSTSGGLPISEITSVAVSGTAQPYLATWSTASGTAPTLNATAINGTSGCNSVPNWNTVGGGAGSQVDVVTAITLPNGKQFLFTYDPTYGLLNRITYPTGGYVSYTWGLNAQSAGASYTDAFGTANSCRYIYDRPAILHRYVSFDGVTVALQQDFSYSTSWAGDTWSTKQTTVTTHDLIRGTVFQTVYAYTPILSPQVPNSTSPTASFEDFADRQVAVEQTVTYKDTTGAVLQTAAKSWSDQYEMTCEIHTLDNGSISGTFFTYGPGHTIVDKREYDFGALTASNCPVAPTVTPTRETTTTYQTFPATPIFTGAASILDRPATISTYGNGTLVAQTTYSYEQSPVSAVANLPTGTHDETNYGPSSAAPRGNATTTTRKCLQACTDAVSTSTFDETGQVLSATDPCGNAACPDVTGTSHTTTYSYADSFDAAPASSTNAYVTQITRPATNGISHIEKFKYAFSDGKLIASTDENGLTTQYSYADPLRRLTQTDSPDGGQTTLSYNDTAPTPSVTTTKKLNATQSVTSVSSMDGVGRATRTQLTSDPQGAVIVDTAYDGLGRTYTVSNPYRAGTDPTTSAGTTTYDYDPLSRKKKETYPDGSFTTTVYCGSWTLVTDATAKWRRSHSDGLGRLIEVDEPSSPAATVASTGCPGTGEPIWVTSYTNDALNNLTGVVQNGSHQRTFTYDSLSRLLTSTNPEVGTLTYTYDANSNVSTKKDARNITVNYGYDALNRGISRVYSNGDPSIATRYDETNCLGLTTCSNIGQRTSMTDAAGSEAWSYQIDAANKRTVHVNQRTTTSTPSNVTKSSTYYLDLAGNLTSVVYPTGRTVNYAYDSASRPVSATDSANGITYATAPATPSAGCLAGAVCYTPQGSVYSMSIGQSASFTGLNIAQTFNNRLQPIEVKASSSAGNAMDLTYSFVDPTTTKNAGHVLGITNNLDSTRSQTFTYDQLNRITAAQTTSTFATSPGHCWGETYSIDSWGNLQSIATTTNTAYTGCSQESGFSAPSDGNNRLTTFSYDISGNTQSDGVNTYAWDAESQMKTAAGVTYFYDGNGRRVSKSNGKLYWYGSGGEILAETDASGVTTAEYIFFGGKRIAMLPAGSTAQFYAEDFLGSSRVVTTNSGVVCYDADFYPYGGERTVTNSCSQNVYKFEGKERDTETGNDDFGARYYSNRFGRWLSADWSNIPVAVPYANLTNPQTLNLYAMVADDPESFADLDGHFQSLIGAAGTLSQTNCANDDALCKFDVEANSINSTSQQSAQNQNQTTQAQNQNQETTDQSATATTATVATATTTTAASTTTTAVEKVTQAEVDKVAKPLIESAAEKVGLRILGKALGLFIGELLTAEPFARDEDMLNAHRKGARESTREKHEEGESRKKADRGGEKADPKRPLPRRRPPGHKGPYPPPGQTTY